MDYRGATSPKNQIVYSDHELRGAGGAKNSKLKIQITFVDWWIQPDLSYRKSKLNSVIYNFCKPFERTWILLYFYWMNNKWFKGSDGIVSKLGDIFRLYSVMQSDRNTFGGVVLVNFNKASKDKNNILDQI